MCVCFAVPAKSKMIIWKYIICRPTTPGPDLCPVHIDYGYNCNGGVAAGSTCSELEIVGFNCTLCDACKECLDTAGEALDANGNGCQAYTDGTVVRFRIKTLAVTESRCKNLIYACSYVPARNTYLCIIKTSHTDWISIFAFGAWQVTFLFVDGTLHLKPWNSVVPGTWVRGLANDVIIYIPKGLQHRRHRWIRQRRKLLRV